MLILFFFTLLLWVIYLKYYLYQVTFKIHLGGVLILLICFSTGVKLTYSLINKFKEINVHIIQSPTTLTPYVENPAFGFDIRSLNQENWQITNPKFPLQLLWTQGEDHFGVLRQVQKSNLNLDLLCRKNFSALFERINIGDTVHKLIDQKSWLKYQFQAQYQGQLVHILSYAIVSEGYFYQMISWTKKSTQIHFLDEIHESFHFR